MEVVNYLHRIWAMDELVLVLHSDNSDMPTIPRPAEGWGIGLSKENGRHVPLWRRSARMDDPLFEWMGPALVDWDVVYSINHIPLEFHHGYELIKRLVVRDWSGQCRTLSNLPRPVPWDTDRVETAVRSQRWNAAIRAATTVL